MFAGEGDQGREAAESAENAIYSLLFEECDKEGTGMVDVKELVEYIRRMQLQVKGPGEGEEFTDTQDSVSLNSLSLSLSLSLSPSLSPPIPLSLSPLCLPISLSLSFSLLFSLNLFPSLHTTSSLVLRSTTSEYAGQQLRPHERDQPGHLHQYHLQVGEVS